MQIRIYFFVLLFFLTGCSQEQNKSENVLAMVNDSPITDSDLDLMAKRTYGKDYTKALDEKSRKLLLESLVFARAIAQEAEAGLTEPDKAIIENKTRAFREELLIQRYLAQNIQPQPVSDKMIKEYYESHLEQFGKAQIRQYEIIMSTRKIKPGQRKRMLAALDEATTQKNWEHWARTLLDKGIPLSFSRGTFIKDKLDPSLSKLILSLDSGEVSSPAFIKGRLYIAKVINIENIKPSPLEDVRFSIKRKLAPLAVKKALEKAKEQILKKAKITYTGK